MEQYSFIIAPWNYAGRQNSVGLFLSIKVRSIRLLLGGKCVDGSREWGNSQIILLRVRDGLWEGGMCSSTVFSSLGHIYPCELSFLFASPSLALPFPRELSSPFFPCPNHSASSTISLQLQPQLEYLQMSSCSS